jgi:hypothetical protein
MGIRTRGRSSGGRAWLVRGTWAAVRRTSSAPGAGAEPSVDPAAGKVSVVRLITGDRIAATPQPDGTGRPTILRGSWSPLVANRKSPLFGIDQLMWHQAREMFSPANVQKGECRTMGFPACPRTLAKSRQFLRVVRRHVPSPDVIRRGPPASPRACSPPTSPRPTSMPPPRSAPPSGSTRSPTT